MGSLSGQYISQSFVSLIHIGSDNTASATFNVLQDGLGNSLGISVNTLGEISASGNIYGLNITGSAGSSINTGSFVTTSSFNAYTASQSTASLVTSITNLNTFTSSQLTINTAIGASTSSLNTFSGSQITKNSTLATYTASVDTKFTAVGVSTSSLNTATASLFTSASLGLTTASFSGNTLTFTKGNGTTFGIVLPDVSGSTLPAGTVSGSAQITAFGFISSSTSPAGTISGSAQITALGFVSSSVTASSLVTASVNVNVITFTKGDASTFSLTVAASGSTTPGTVSGSAQIVELGFLQTSSFQTYTGSEDTKNTAIGASTSSLNSFTASAQTSINALNTFTASQYVSNSFFATTGSNTFVGNQTITGNITAFSASFTYLQTIFESSSVIYSSGSNQFGDELTDIQTLSGSVKVQGSLTVNGTPVQTSSADITALNAFTSSQLTINSAIGASTSSLNTATSSLFTSASLGLTTASVSLNTITFTKGDGTTFPITVNTGSAGGAAFPFTGSAVITGSLEVSGSVADIFIGGGRGIRISQSLSTATDAITVTAVTYPGYVASPSALKSFGDTVNRIISAPDTGASPTKTNTFNITRVHNAGVLGEWTLVGYGTDIGNNGNAGGIYIGKGQSDNTVTSRHTIGFNYIPPTTSEAYNFVFAGQSAYDIAQGGPRTAILGHLFVSQSFTASLQNGYAWVGNSTGYNTQVTTSSFATPIPTGTISGSQQITSLGFVSSSVTASSLVTASFAGNTLTFTKGDASTFGIVIPDNSGSAGDFVTTSSFNAYTASSDQKVNSLISATGSYATTGSNTFTGNQTISSSLFISGNINMVNGSDLVTHHVKAAGSNGLELQTSAGAIIVSMGAGGGTQAGFVGAVSANSISASTINGLGDPLAFSTSVDSRLDSLEAATSSYVTSAITASSLVTASFSGNTLTFTKGDASTFGVVIPDVSGSTINTGSFATTGSNAFFGTNTFSGAVAFTGSAPTILSSSFSGSIITNLTDTYTDVAAVNQIVTLTSASYAALASGSLTNSNTLYIVSGSTSGSITSATLGSNTFSGSQIFTGSVQGNVVSMSIASATASMDLNTGNYFTLSIPSGSTRIATSNIKSGTSATLVITTASGSLVTFDSSVKQPSGSAYVPTSGSVDVLSFVSVNSSSLFVVSTKNMI